MRTHPRHPAPERPGRARWGRRNRRRRPRTTGLAIGTLFNLFVVPVVYMIIAADHSKEREHDRELDTKIAEGMAPAA